MQWRSLTFLTRKESEGSGRACGTNVLTLHGFLPGFGISFLPLVAAAHQAADAALRCERRGWFARTCSLMKRLTVDVREVPLMKQEMQSACFPSYSAQERKLEAQVKKATCFERL